MNQTNTADDHGLVLPEVVRRYQGAHDRRETETALAAFAPEAVVTDENNRHEGSEQIRHWLSTASTQFTYTRTLIEAEQISASTWVVVNHLEGDFPGGRVDLRYHYTLADNLISELTIAP